MSAERWVRNGRPPSYYGRRGGCNLSEAEENEAAQQGSVYVVPSQFEAASGWRPSGMGSCPMWDPLDEVGSTERWGRRDARRGVAVRWCMQSPCDLHAICMRSPYGLHAICMHLTPAALARIQIPAVAEGRAVGSGISDQLRLRWRSPALPVSRALGFGGETAEAVSSRVPTPDPSWIPAATSSAFCRFAGRTRTPCAP